METGFKMLNFCPPVFIKVNEGIPCGIVFILTYRVYLD